MIAIRHAEPSDIPALVGLIKALGFDVVAETLAGKLASFDASDMDALLVVERDGFVVACMGLHAMEILPVGRLGRITAILVANHARRQGIGTRLMDAAVRYFESQECTLIEVASGGQVTGDQALFRAFGFAEEPGRFIKKLG